LNWNFSPFYLFSIYVLTLTTVFYYDSEFYDHFYYSPIEGMPMLGALDMGGSSTQLIFFNGTRDAKKVHADDFWAHSWLNYGAHRIQQRVLDYIYATYMLENSERIVQQHQQQLHQHLYTQTSSSSSSSSSSTSSATSEYVAESGSVSSISTSSASKQCLERFYIPNPCDFIDHEIHSEHSPHIIFRGTGEAEKCMDILERVIWPTLQGEDLKDACMRGRPCPIESIEHPSVRGHHFYAMSVYFFALDCMRHMIDPMMLEHWPKPTLAEVEEAAIQFCSQHWSKVSELFHQDRHPYTRDIQLHDRCFESLYIITLLEKGFGFDRHERTITYALEVRNTSNIYIYIYIYKYIYEGYV
jgi:hypothetical protein